VHGKDERFHYSRKVDQLMLKIRGIDTSASRRSVMRRFLRSRKTRKVTKILQDYVNPLIKAVYVHISRSMGFARGSNGCNRDGLGRELTVL